MQKLEDLGKIIMDLSKGNQMCSSIAESSLNSIRSMICTNERFDQVLQPNELIPPQISQTNQMTQQMIAQQAIMSQTMQGTPYGQSLLPPMMGNQYNALDTSNIPFLYHQKGVM